MRPARRLALWAVAWYAAFALMMLALGGCAGVKLTGDALAGREADKVAADKVCAKVYGIYIVRGKQMPQTRKDWCGLYPTTMNLVKTRGAFGLTDQYGIKLDASLYEPKMEIIRRAVFAHEMVHGLRRHYASQECSTAPAVCENEANVGSVGLLVIGWDMSEAEAIRLQYTFLKVRAGEPGNNGHASACDEIKAFSAGIASIRPGVQLEIPAACGGAA